MSKKIITLTFLLLSVSLFAQDVDSRIERVKALRIAYISDKLDLSPDEAQKFWPIFNQFDNKQLELNKQKRKLLYRLKPINTANLSEKETLKLMEEDEKLETEIQNNRRQLGKDLQGVISNQKILMLKQIEIEFKNKLLQQMKHRRGERMNK